MTFLTPLEKELKKGGKSAQGEVRGREERERSEIHMNSFSKTNNDCISKSLTPRTTRKQVPFTTASGAARFALAAARHQWRRYCWTLPFRALRCFAFFFPPPAFLCFAFAAFAGLIHAAKDSPATAAP